MQAYCFPDYAKMMAGLYLGDDANKPNPGLAMQFANCTCDPAHVFH